MKNKLCSPTAYKAASDEFVLPINKYKLGGKESAPQFGPYDNDFPYDETVKPTWGDRLDWIIWGIKVNAAGLPVPVKKGIVGAVSAINLPVGALVLAKYHREISDDLKDATIAYNRYRSGTGENLKIDYNRAYAEAPELNSVINQELICNDLCQV